MYDFFPGTYQFLKGLRKKMETNMHSYFKCIVVNSASNTVRPNLPILGFNLER